MNKWFRRAVGSVGVAGGVLLLGAGTAHAHVSVPAAMDPQQLHGQINDLFTPAGGPNNQALALDRVAAPANQLAGTPVPGVLSALPIDDPSGTADLAGLGAPAPDSVLPGLLSGNALAGSVPDVPSLPPLEGPMGELPGLAPGMNAPDPLGAGRHALVRQVVDSIHPGVDGPNMIGDDFVDQSSYAGTPPALGGVLPGLDSLGGLIGSLGTDSLPTDGLPIFDSVPRVPVLSDLPAPPTLDLLDGLQPGRHRALPATDPDSAADLPIFGSVLPQAPTNGSHQVASLGGLLG